MHTLDPERVAALIAPDGRLLTADGRRAQGREAVGEVIANFVRDLRSASHMIVAQWHQDDVWIAEE